MNRITYLHHSAFLIELAHTVLLFDYTQGALPTWDSKKKLYVFASHAHGDHYVPSIFQLSAAAFFLSEDITPPAACSANIHSLAPHESVSIDALHVHTFFSTDEGVAFLVECEGERIYHAGDLHNWYWEEDTKATQAMMKERYEKELLLVKPFAPSIAFVVLDPRQGAHGGDGMDAFWQIVSAPAIFPMHLWQDFAYAKRYQQAHPSIPLCLYDHDHCTFVQTKQGRWTPQDGKAI